MKKIDISFKKVLLIAAGIASAVVIFILAVNYLKPYYNPENIKAWVMSFGKFSVIAFMLLQILQVVIFFIPGEVVQAAGGYIYGTGLGLLLSIAGILLGSAMTFIIARKFGDRLLIKILPSKDYIKMKALINKPKNKLVVFILYLMPGFPKDVLGYVCGITTLSLKWFITISTIARVPGILMSVFLGSKLYQQNYKLVIIVFAVIVIFFIIGMLKQDKILDRLE